MNTAPATRPLSTPEGEPQHQAGAPPAPEPITLSRWQTIVIGVVAAGAVGIATLGFIGSYNAVADLAQKKGFHGFAAWFPIAVDLGIAVFLALDLVLTRLRMPYPLLRYGAWLLTGATISFNAAVAWRPADRPAADGPDYLGAAMHAVIPLLFVIAVEAARHAVGRIAQITADTHYENPPVSRWILALPSTFRLYRWMRTRGIRSYTTALTMQRDIHLYIAELKKEHGRWWRTRATAYQLLVLRFAREGIPMDKARKLPAENRAAVEQIRHEEEEARKDAEEQRRRAREEADRKRREAAEQEKRNREEADRQRRLAQEEEDRRRRLAQEEEARLRRLAEEEQETELARQEAERRRLAAEAEAAEQAAREKARIAVETAQRIAAAEAAAAEAKANAEKLAAAARTDAERAAAQEAARAARAEAEAAERLANAKARDAIQRIEADRRERERQAAASRRANGPASAAANAASRPANGPANGAANAASRPANAASRPASEAANAASAAANRPASRPANGTASTGRAIGIDEVVATYRQLASKRGKAPSDRELGEALEVSRSRAQQLRTEAIEAGHTDLAKPLRVA